MHVTRFAAIALLGLPLGGCFGVTTLSQPVPDWAMSPQAQYNEPAATPRKQRAARRTTAPQPVAENEGALVTGEVSATPEPSTKPFSPGWDGREDERDASLRRTMTICRGC